MRSSLACVWTVLALGLLGGCVQTPIQAESNAPSEPRKIEVSITGANLLPAEEALPDAQPTVGGTPPSEAPLPPPQVSEAQQGESKTEPAQEGDVLEMKPGDQQIQGPEGAVSPFDPDAIYRATIETLIPDNRPITIERSETLNVPQLLEALARFGGFNIAVADGLDDLKISRVNFPSIPLRDAFIAILKRYKLNLTRIGDVLWIDRGNQAGDDMVYRVLRLNSISATSLSSQLAQILSGGTGGAAVAASAAGASGATPGGAVTGTSTPNGFFTVHPDSNTIFIRAKPELVEAMAQFISAVDFRGRQVLIEMSLFEVSVDDSTKLGSALSVSDFFTAADGNSNADFLSNFLFTSDADPNMLLNDLEGGTTSGLNTNKTTFLFRVQGGANDRYKGFLDWLQTFATVDLLSSPRIVAVNGKAAEINIIEKIPYIQQTSTVGTGGTTTSQEILFEEVGIKLKVTPTIQEDRHVRMAIEPEISEEKEKFQNVPVVNKRLTKTEVVVANETTFAFGGLMKSQTNYKEEKVPLLGDIPLLGLLFRRTEEIDKKIELLILITPRILESDEQAAAMTSDWTQRFDRKRASLRGPKREN